MLKKYDFILSLSCILLYALNNLVIKPNTEIIFFHWYFNDLLAGALFLSYCSYILLISKYHYILKDHILVSLGLILVAGILWEIKFAFLNRVSVSDPVDIVFYLFGAILNLCCYRFYLSFRQHAI